MKLSLLVQAWRNAADFNDKSAIADAGHNNGLRCEGLAEGLRECATDLEAALAQQAQPEMPTPGEIGHVIGMMLDSAPSFEAIGVAVLALFAPKETTKHKFYVPRCLYCSGTGVATCRENAMPDSQ